MLSPIVGLFLVTFLTLASAQFQNKYPESKALNNDFTVHWLTDLSTKSVKIGLEVKTTGWVGFGIGEQTSGTMMGADIAAISIVSGQAYLQDMYATAFETPKLDGCQNWKLVGFSQSGGVNYVELERLIDTGDVTQDRPVRDGATKVIYAYGTSAQNAMVYHDSRRGMGEIVFYQTVPPYVRPYDPDEKTADLLMGEHDIPPFETNYMCRSQPMPNIAAGSKDAHIVHIDPVLDPRSTKYTHHMLVHICDDVIGGYVGRFARRARLCISPVGDFGGGCQSLLYGWAQGIGGFPTPPEAGYRIGPKYPAFQYVVIEYHFNNPDHDLLKIDNSGLRIYYTPHLRKYDAGTMTVGDPIPSLPWIPAGIADNLLMATCPRQCTREWKTNMNVFASSHHMHYTGARMWTTHYRDGKLIGTINRVEYYDFDSQQITPVIKVVEPGDELNVHCVYDTTNRKLPTRFGLASVNEMCMDFIAYYPRLEFNGGNYGVCGHIGGGIFGFPRINFTFCGNVGGILNPLNSAIRLISNPSIFDGNLGMDRTWGGPSTCRQINYVGVGVGAGVAGLALLGIGAAGFMVVKKRTQYQTIPDMTIN